MSDELLDVFASENTELATLEKAAQLRAAQDYEAYRLTIDDDVFARTSAAPRLSDLQRAMGLPRWECTGDDSAVTQRRAAELLGRRLRRARR